jgi:F0F1-type ATP synthase assembly protein I
VLLATSCSVEALNVLLVLIGTIYHPIIIIEFNVVVCVCICLYLPLPADGTSFLKCQMGFFHVHFLFLIKLREYERERI